jgi:hypothetical protein
MLWQELKESACQLSPRDRLALVSAIVESLQETSIAQSERKSAIERMRGLLKGDQPAPTDQEVETILEERRAEKFRE